ncbi:hypothetical protein JJL45_05605 [Tamlana sp. s12]|uniref:lipid-binding protein n=1 Tax=Tamlana sp. s12 TaxID=1630406 RepID=UPI0007FD67F9|nr:lipid-binding protein [Tamlana sp. s12]OBQ56022.1 hypothetical protein VQ01_06450 [Tamlana sp. s12]QQY83469.1 hypothetical protein JJL45_05605 [Tamlana sp. s12]
MKIYKSIIGALILMVSLSFTSCDEVEDVNVGGSSVEKMSGDWWVIALEPDGVTPAYGGDYVQFSTYNTAANNDMMWVDDHGHWMEIKTQVETDLDAMTFEGEPNSDELITGGTVSVTNGVITKATYETSSNTMVDEITFEAEFDWAPGTVFKFKGHKRTGFAEDENPHYSN